jgi:type IV secretory pathway TraG/TraD family ATPase VirD4
MLQSRLAGFLAGLVILSVLWLVIASAAFLWLSGLWDDPRLVWWSRPWIWATYAPRGDGSLSEWLYLIAAAVIASMPAVVYVRFVVLSQVGGLRLPFGKGRRTERVDTDNHGHADYMTLPVMQALFPPVPDQDIGGVVVGEADRVDLGPAARIPFDPENRATWGQGGRAPLMIDPCRRGSTHSMVIGGGGTYKSTTLVTSLLTWRKSIFCLDPAEELAALVAAELADRGRKVMRLEIGGSGPNVLDGRHHLAAGRDAVACGCRPDHRADERQRQGREIQALGADDHPGAAGAHDVGTDDLRRTEDVAGAARRAGWWHGGCPQSPARHRRNLAQHAGPVPGVHDVGHGG